MRGGGVYIGLVLMVSGWLLVLTAMVLLSGTGGRAIFAGAGLAVELLGLGVFSVASRPAFKARAAEWGPPMTTPISLERLLPLIVVLIAPLAVAGLVLMQQGLGRSRSAAHAMLASLAAIALAVLAFVFVGSSLAGYGGGAARTLTLAGLTWDWLGAGPALAQSVGTGSVVYVLELVAVALAVLIPIGAGGDRWRLAPVCLSTAVLAGLLFPLFAHWAWGGGWLTSLRTLVHLPSFVDAGGAGVIHVVGGMAALSVSSILGPRRGKYTEDGQAIAIPAHNIVLVLLGAMLTLIGLTALECASSMLFYGLAPAQLPRVLINAAVAASAGGLAALVTTTLRYRKPDASLTANGWVAGLVAASAAAGFVSPLAAFAIAGVAGAFVTFAVELLELRLCLDDPSGAVPVHLLSGLWGLLAVGLLGHGGGNGPYVLAQIVGIATLLGCMFPLLHGMNLLLNRLVRFRVDADGDWQGMDVRELGAGAYPEFVIHADEFVPR